VQAQIWFTRKEFGILVLWSPRDMKKFKIEKDYNWPNNLSILSDFYYEKLLPEILHLNVCDDDSDNNNNNETTKKKKK
jgi:hypothetical protein